MRYSITLISVLVATILVAGCASNQNAQTNQQQQTTQTPAAAGAPDFSKLSPDCFVPYTNNPIIKQGDFVSGATWNDPHVIKVDGKLVMYSSADQNFDQKIKVYRLVSDDGIKWALSPSTHVFEGSHVNGTIDAKNAETPAVVFFKDKYYLFYIAYPVIYSDVYSYTIGMAISDDGINWVRQPDPVVTPTDPRGTVPNLDFNQWIVGEPAPVIFNNKIYLYFSAVGADLGTSSTMQTIGLTTSSDGITWSAPQKVLRPDQTVYPRNESWIGYTTPNAIVMGGKMHLYVSAANENPTWKQITIHHAVSSDGISNWIQDSKVIFDRSDFEWTKEEMRSPAVLLDGNKLYLWFAGHRTTSEGLGNIGMALGLATCDLS